MTRAAALKLLRFMQKESFGDENSNAIVPMFENAAQLDNNKAECENN
jgi:hypothetical protein